MALSSNASMAAAKFSTLSIGRQVGLLIGLAASIAIGIGVVLWSHEPNYRPLFSQLNSRDAGEVIDVLQRSGIAYKVNTQNGNIQVANEDIQQARMKLAAEGLPRGNGRGFELFSNSNSFTTSQFMETAKLKLALETELARTISQFNDIKSARLHLALPRESAFVRDNRKPSASVFIDVYSGFTLKKNTIASIVSLVASSVPNMNPDDVTVVDQNGQLLNEGGNDNLFSMTDRYLEYRTQLEHNYSRKIRELLTPILGIGKVKAKVSADIDFTQTEQTREMYNPDMAALRSEQSMQEKRQVGTEAAGVTGAQANQANASEDASKGATTQQGSGASDFKHQSTKNYELDKTISHTKNQPGRIKRLTVAVLVDNRQIKDPKSGKVTTETLSKDEIAKIKTLVANAIGLDVNRGDSLNVISSNFVKPAPIEALPELTLWQKPWFWSVIKQVLSALFILVLVFGVLRPILKNLVSRKEESTSDEALADNSSAQTSESNMTNFDKAGDFDAQMNNMKQIASQQPQQVAQVVKSWVDGG